MNRIWMVAGAGLLLVTFVLGLLVGLRRRPADGAGSTTSYSVSPSAAAGSSEGCIDFREAASQVGKEGCVSGQVLRVFTSKNGNSFLDFCADYRNCPFTSVIFAADQAKFGDLGTLRGRRVEIRGAITTYQGRAEIVIHSPEQIRSAR